MAARAQWQPAPVAAGLLKLGLRMCDCRTVGVARTCNNINKTQTLWTPSAQSNWIKVNESHDMFPMLKRHAV